MFNQYMNVLKGGRKPTSNEGTDLLCLIGSNANINVTCRALIKAFDELETIYTSNEYSEHFKKHVTKVLSQRIEAAIRLNKFEVAKQDDFAMLLHRYGKFAKAVLDCFPEKEKTYGNRLIGRIGTSLLLGLWHHRVDDYEVVNAFKETFIQTPESFANLELTTSDNNALNKAFRVVFRKIEDKSAIAGSAVVWALNLLRMIDYLPNGEHNQMVVFTKLITEDGKVFKCTRGYTSVITQTVPIPIYAKAIRVLKCFHSMLKGINQIPAEALQDAVIGFVGSIYNIVTGEYKGSKLRIVCQYADSASCGMRQKLTCEKYAKRLVSLKEMFPCIVIIQDCTSNKLVSSDAVIELINSFEPLKEAFVIVYTNSFVTVSRAKGSPWERFFRPVPELAAAVGSETVACLM